jgi:hypothetical protein
MIRNIPVLIGLLLLISDHRLVFLGRVMILALPIILLRILVYTDPREKLVMLLKSWWLIQDLILMKYQIGLYYLIILLIKTYGSYYDIGSIRLLSKIAGQYYLLKRLWK